MREAPALNLLVLLCDQLQRNVLGPYGGPVPTPNWDRVAEAGVVFDRFYCATPLCVPTRPSMMTGRWPHTHGSISFGEGYATMNEGEELLIDRLLDAGYHVGYEGIWHINRPEQDERSGEYAHFVSSGFPYAEHVEMLEQQGGKDGDQRGAVRTPTDEGYHDWSFSIPVPATWTRPLEEHPDMLRARHIADFILSAPPDKPVAAWSSLGAPHPPLLVPEPYISMFDPADMEPPPGFGEDMSGMPEAVAEAPGAQSVRGWSWEQWSVAIAAYYGFVAFTDACHGVVLNALEQSGRADESIVIMSCDHGEMLGSHNLYQKGVMYDRSIRLPFILSAPGIEPGRRGQLVSQVDMAPTVLDLLGMEPLAHAQGETLVPILREPSFPGRKYVFSEFNGYINGGFRIRACMSDRYKYVYHHEDRDQLFDYVSDPGELENLVEDPAQAEVARKMRDVLSAWMQETGDFIGGAASGRGVLDNPGSS